MDKEGYVEILNSSLHKLDKFSFCGYFNTNQFNDHNIAASKANYKYSGHTIFSTPNMQLSSVVQFCHSIISQSSSSSESDSDKCTQNKDRLKGASGKRFYVYSRIFDEEFEFDVWEPGKWNKFCVKADLKKETASLTINSMLIKNYTIKEKYETEEENIIMMNTEDLPTPFREGFIKLLSPRLN